MNLTEILEKTASGELSGSETAAAIDRALGVAPAPVPIAPRATEQPGVETAFRDELTSMVARILGVPRETFRADAAVADYGITSVMMAEFTEQFRARFGIDIAVTVFFEYTDVASLIASLYRRHARKIAEAYAGGDDAPARRADDLESLWAGETRRAPAPGAEAERDSVAIIGMSGTFPGSSTLDELWAHLVAGDDLITPYPRERARWQMPRTAWPDDLPGGYIDDVDAFDAAHFGVTPREARLMDPQQRWMLQSVWSAIEHAGYTPRELAGSRTGVFIAAATHDYQDLLVANGVAVDAFMATGLPHSITANRVSHAFDFRGPSEPVDVACPSVLVALHRAVAALERGECEAAVVGGVNLILTSSVSDAFRKAGFLSARGRCRSFAAGGDGFVRGEGAGAILLKPLRNAIADGDTIHALVRGTAVQHGGRAATLMAPSVEAQAATIVRAIERAGIDAATVGVVEAYGLGGELSDQVEVLAMRRARARLGVTTPWRIGSIKSNAGSLETASGIASIIKVVLAMRHGVVPPSLYAREADPKLALSEGDLVLLDEAWEWPANGTPRRAGISSFGYGGVAAHVVLEEPPRGISPLRTPRTPHAFAKTRFWIPGATERSQTESLPVERLEELAQRMVVRAFRARGELRTTGETFTASELAARMPIAAKHGRLLDALLRMLEEGGWLTRDGSRWIVAAKEADPESVLKDAEALAAQHPELRGHVGLLEAVAPRYGEVLSGAISATELLFPHSSLQLVAACYGGNPVADRYNDDVARAARDAYERLSQDGRTVRMLEIGAGTGGTTARVLAALPPDARVEYVFTDVSRALAAQGVTRFRERHPFVTFQAFDVERPPQEQQLGEFDVAVAANIFHTTRDLRRALRHTAAALRPGGALIVNELTRITGFTTVVFGLLDGWWAFEDGELRIDGSPLVDAATWRGLLAANGFDEVTCIGEETLPQHVFVARRDATPMVMQAPAAAPPARRRQGVRDVLLRRTAEAIGVEASAVDAEAPFVDLGIDSFSGVELVDRINKDLGIELCTVSLFDFTTVNDLAAHIATAHAVREPERAQEMRAIAPVERDEPIAVVGMAGRFPGADDVDAFWRMLERGESGIAEVPPERWDVNALYDPDPKRQDRTHSRWGGFLSGVDQFDAFFFRIPGREAAMSDPQQRLFLEVCWHALEDAGHANRDLIPRNTAVFAGAGATDYFERLRQAGIAPPAQSFWGNAASVIASRISYFLDLHGPSVAVDTACSSSLVAIHQACASLRAGETDLALAGGVFVITMPSFYIMASNAEMLAPDGRCKTFDRAANGFVPGEAAAALVLRRLSDAQRDGDRILGVIRATGVNQDGKTNGITAPNGSAQTELERSVYERAGIDPRSITYVEAHGTGTILGDPIEVEALTGAFRHSTADKHFCAIGSVKTNIGHTATAAGVCSVVKVLLALQHRRIPPSLHFREPNPHIDFANSPFYVNDRLAEWPVPAGTPRRAAVSSFGFGGTNAHAVIEEAPPAPASQASNEPQLVVLSARTETALARLKQSLLKRIEDEDLSLADVAFTLQHGRTHWPVRFAAVVVSMDELRQALRGRPFHGELAERYLAGDSIDWNALHRPGTRRRLALPLYPFERQRYWLDEPAPQAGSAPLWFAPAEHPLDIVDGQPPMPLLVFGEAVLDVPCIRVEAADRFARLATDHYTIRPDAVDDYRELLAAVAPASIVHAWALTNASDERTILSIAALGRAWHDTQRRPLICVYAYTPGGGPGAAAPAAFGRSIEALLPDARFTSLRVAPSCSREQRVRAIAQLLAVPPDTFLREAAIDANGFTVRTLEPVELATSARYRTRGTFLITGGAGGLGAHVARHLAERCHARIALVGRSPLDERRQQLLDEVRARGGEAVYFTADVADETAMRGVLDAVRERFGALHGVFHTAGVLDPRPLTEKDGAAVREVLRAKVEGARVLDRLVGPEPLDCFVLFSSAAAWLGDFGQGDYGMANRFLEELAAVRRGNAVAIAWPLWRDGGMHAGAGAEELYRAFSGLEPLDTAAGLRALDAAVGSGRSQLLLLNGDRARITKLLTAKRRAVVPQAALRPVPRRGAAPAHDLVEELGSILAEIGGIDRARIDPRLPLGDYGLDSLMLADFVAAVAAHLDVELLPTVVFHHGTIEKLAAHLLAEHDLQPKGVARPAMEDAIAIVGMSGIFPGSPDLDALWTNLAACRDLTREVPPERWDWREAAADSVSHRGGFLDDVTSFDAPFFRIAPVDAEVMDPQQRLFLEQAWKAIEDAGHAPGSLEGRRIGVFAGVQFRDYEDLLLRNGIRRPQAAAGNSHALIANRVSHTLSLRGPSEAIDTACSSSLVAIHRAVQSIRAGECEWALAGGVSLMLSPNTMIAASAMGVLSPSGRCRTFDAAADGFVKGEGVGVLVLKPLRQALADGNPIHALIRGTAVNHDGRSTSLTAPNAEAQRELLVDAYRSAGVEPSTVTFLELHGTGTRLGDPAEVEAIQAAFAQLGPEAGPPCGLGSIKTNIGHLEPAAGVAGAIKVLLAMRHRTLPGTPGLETLNPYLRLDGTRFGVVAATRAWDAPSPLRAGVTSLGFGGSNAHVILESYDGPVVEASSRGPWIVPLSARNDERLREAASRLARHLEARREEELASIAYTLQAGRDAMPARVAIVASNVRELQRALDAFASGDAAAEPSDARAAAFMRGERVDWSELWPAPPRRCSLPGYPFERRRYWFDAVREDAPREIAPYDGDEVVLALDGEVAVVTMRDEANSNMFSERLVRGLMARFDAIGADRGVKAIVLTGHDRVFVTGGTEQGLLDIAEQRTQYSDFPFLYEGLLRCEIPVISAMQGHAFGAGFVFGLYADLIVLSEDGVYSANFMRYGFTPGLGATLILRDRLGVALANEMMFTGRSYSGRELQQRGASLLVVPREQVKAEAIRIAQALAEKPREALRLLKRELAARVLTELPRVVAAETALQRRTFAAPVVKERVREQFDKARLQIAAKPGNGFDETFYDDLLSELAAGHITAGDAARLAAAPSGDHG